MRKQYAGSAGTIETTSAFASSVGEGQTFTTNTGSGYPDGSIGPFVIMVESQFTGAKEKILCSARAGNVFTIQQRGYDGTVAINVTAGDTVKHVIDAASLDEASATAALHEQPQVHVSNTFTVADVNALPDTYPEGISYGFAGVAQGFPANGNLITNRYNLNYTSQTIVSRDTPSESGVWVRGGRDTVWSGWRELVNTDSNIKPSSILEPYPSDPAIMIPVPSFSTTAYVVPAGYVFRMVYSRTTTTSYAMFNGVNVTSNSFMYGGPNNVAAYLFDMEFYAYFPAGTSIVTNNAAHGIFGYLIPESQFFGTPVAAHCPSTSTYVVPAGKNFVMTYAYGNNAFYASPTPSPPADDRVATQPNYYQGNYIPVQNPRGLIYPAGHNFWSTGTMGFVSGYLVDA